MTVRERRLVPATLLLLASVACGTSPTDPDPSVQETLADSVRLAPGEEVAAGIFRLAFQEVASDSRCPVDAVCIWQGNAAVQITVGVDGGPSQPRTLNTSDGTPSVDFSGFRVTLLGVQPEPQAAVPIPPGDYRASFRIEALED
jgi:hypothetical protein